jgi:hypothetical protein
MIIPKSTLEQWDLFPRKPVQDAYFNDKHKRVCVLASRRTGKTQIAKQLFIKWALTKTRPEGYTLYYYAPDLDQAERIIVKPFMKMIPPELKPRANMEKCRIFLNNGNQIWWFSDRNAESSEGTTPSPSFILIDESQKMPLDFLVQQVIEPVFSEQTDYKLLVIGTARSNSRGSAQWKALCEKAQQDEEWGYHTWAYGDIFSAEATEKMRRRVSEAVWLAEYCAIWTPYGELVAPKFSPISNVTDMTYVPRDEITITCDFNVDKMSWLLIHDDGVRILVYDEIRMRRTNTYEALDEVFRRYPNAKTINVYGDCASRQRSTSAKTGAESDFAIISHETRATMNMRIIEWEQRPSVADRANATNDLICGLNNERRLLINSNCKTTVRDCIELVWGEDGRIDTSNPEMGHSFDALSYYCFSEYRLRINPNYDTPTVFSMRR